MSQSATGAGIGQPVRRMEDKRLITGQGRFSDDMNLPGQVHAVMLRSPHAHARIKSIDIENAMAAPGVLAVLTGKDLLADGLKPIPHIPLLAHPAEIQPVNSDGSPMFTAPHYPLAIDKVRYVGEAIAVVVARTIAAAKDGAEQVEVDYEPLPAVTDTAAAAEPDAPRLFDEAKSNVCLDAQLGDRAKTEAAFARAAHVVKFETWVQRITGVPMEPRAAVSDYDPETKRYTLIRRQRRRGAPEERSRDRARGSFGLGARHHARCRRQFRHARHDLSGILPRGLGRAARRPSGQVAVRAERSLPLRLPGARSGRRGRARARRRRQFPRHARLQHRQCRRAHDEFLAAAKRRRDHVEHLPDAGGEFPRPRRAEQHLADAPLSQRRPAGSHVRHGAADRSRLPRLRLRPRRNPPPQSAHAGRAALHAIRSA